MGKHMKELHFSGVAIAGVSCPGFPVYLKHTLISNFSVCLKSTFPKYKKDSSKKLL